VAGYSLRRSGNDGGLVVLYHLFGKQGLLASIVLAILLSNLQGPKLTIIFGMQTSLGVIFYSSIFFATDLLSEKYGRAEANRAVLIGFTVSVIIYCLDAQSRSAVSAIDTARSRGFFRRHTCGVPIDFGFQSARVLTSGFFTK
jgi:hypothetical protein